jgi:hypothetical protein
VGDDLFDNLMDEVYAAVVIEHDPKYILFKGDNEGEKITPGITYKDD